MSGHIQIGEVAERAGLSLRTIRHYYTAVDVDRLRLIRQMRVFGFDLDEMRDLIALAS